jgi:hypothetical protein
MATSYFSRTPASTGNRRTFTFSTWIKKSDATSRFQLLFMGNSYSGSNLNSGIYFNSSNKLNIQTVDNGANAYILTTTQLFRDVSAWYHIVIAIDTTQATDTNRIKLYVNGLQVTAFDTATYPTQNLETAYNQVSIPQVIGHRDSEASNYYFDGLMANTILVDGQQLTPSSFGETDATTGIWKFKGYSGSYGTNGFFLKFENSASLGTDSSGNGNNFTVNGTPTQTVDTPSNNFATGNPLYRASNNNTFTNGNLTFTGSGESFPQNIATFQPTAGKWYWETKIITKTTNPIIGMAWNGYTSGGTGRVAYRADGYILTPDGNETSGYSSFTNSDIIGCALDLNSGTTTLKFYKNNTLIYTYNNITTGLQYSTRGEGMIFFQLYTSDVISANFGNGYFATTAITSPNSDGAGLGKFQYAVPSGYYALCTKNINVYG